MEYHLNGLIIIYFISFYLIDSCLKVKDSDFEYSYHMCRVAFN
jgi:hypothetical protein